MENGGVVGIGRAARPLHESLPVRVAWIVGRQALM